MEKAARRKKISKIIYVIGMLGVIMLNYLAWRSREKQRVLRLVYRPYFSSMVKYVCASDKCIIYFCGRNYADSGSRDYCVRNRLFYL